MEITSYYIDDNNTMHTYINELKHFTISDIMNIEQAELLINELNNE